MIKFVRFINYGLGLGLPFFIGDFNYKHVTIQQNHDGGVS